MQANPRAFLRVASFNVYWRLRDREARLARATDVLRSLDADVIALQEVARWLGDEQLPSDCWARSLGVAAFHDWLERGLIFSQGLALLSRLPLHDAHLVPFESNRIYNSKGVAHAQIETSKGPLIFLNVHLAATHAGETKAKQWQQLGDMVRSSRKLAPVVVVGDFNEPPETATFQRFLADFAASHVHGARPPVGGLKSWTGGYGQACDAEDAELIDNIVVIPGGPAQQAPVIVGGGIIPLKAPFASDHCPVVADLAWPFPEMAPSRRDEIFGG